VSIAAGTEVRVTTLPEKPRGFIWANAFHKSEVWVVIRGSNETEIYRAQLFPLEDLEVVSPLELLSEVAE